MVCWIREYAIIKGFRIKYRNEDKYAEQKARVEKGMDHSTDDNFLMVTLAVIVITALLAPVIAPIDLGAK